MVYLNKGLYAYRERTGSLSHTWTGEWMPALVCEMEEKIGAFSQPGGILLKKRSIFINGIKGVLGEQSISWFRE